MTGAQSVLRRPGRGVRPGLGGRTGDVGRRIHGWGVDVQRTQEDRRVRVGDALRVGGVF